MHSYVIGLLILIIIVLIVCPPVWLMKKICNSCPSCHSRVAASPAAESYIANNCVGTFDCLGEDFTANGDIAANTMWSGYQYRTELPRGRIM
jgi:hypothetical protein